MRLHEFASPEALAASLAAAIAEAVRQRLHQRGEAAIALSGGTTPKLLFPALCRQPLDWKNVTITLVDDRWVPETSDRSNAARLRAALLCNEAAAARFIPLVTGDATPEAGLQTAQARLRGLPLPFAAVTLGMGEDGHTASLFPGGDHLTAALHRDSGEKLATMRAPGAGEPRITLTLPVLLEAGLVAIHIEGDSKRAVLAAAMQPGDPLQLPIRAILARQPAPDIFWCA